MFRPRPFSYAADLEKAAEYSCNWPQQHPHVREVVGCPLTALGDSSVTLTVQAWCVDAGFAKQVEFDLLEQAKKCFQDENIEIPFPYQNVVLTSVPPSV